MNSTQPIHETTPISLAEAHLQIPDIQHDFNQHTKFGLPLPGDEANFRVVNGEGKLAGMRLELPISYARQEGIAVHSDVTQTNVGDASHYYFPPQSAEAVIGILMTRGEVGNRQAVLDYKRDYSADLDRAPQAKTLADLALRVQLTDSRDIIFIAGAQMAEYQADPSISTESPQALLDRFGFGQGKEDAPRNATFVRRFLTDPAFAQEVHEGFKQRTDDLWNTQPTPAYVALERMVSHIGYPLVFSFDYSVKALGSGLSVMRRTAMGWNDDLGFSYADPAKEERRRMIGATMERFGGHGQLAIPIGVDLDREALRYLSERNPNLLVAALGVEADAPYLASTDWYVPGDVHQLTDGLAKLVVGNS